MSNKDDEFNSSPGFLKYKIEQLEKLVYPLIDLVNSLDKKLSLLTQKILIATILLGSAFQAGGIWYSSTTASKDSYADEEKKVCYEMRVKESETVKSLKEEIARLKQDKGVR